MFGNWNSGDLYNFKQVPAFHFTQLKFKTGKMSSSLRSSILPYSVYTLKYKKDMSKLDILPLTCIWKFDLYGRGARENQFQMYGIENLCLKGIMMSFWTYFAVQRHWYV